MTGNTEVSGARRRGWPLVAAGGVLVLAVGAGVGWAVSAVFAPPEDALVEAPFTFVELVDGEVGSSVSLNAVAEWPQAPAGTNQAVGTVTSVSVAAGDEVAPGQVLYSVNLRPVVVAAGATPSFRSMSRGVSGADVAQLQGLLAGLGLFDGDADGVFGWATEAAVRDWQDSLGIEDDGVVQAGDVVFVPSLPGRVAVDEEVVYRGASLAGGEEVVSGLAVEPTFTIPATAAQAAMMPAGTRVELTAQDAAWGAVVAGQEPDPASPDVVNVGLQADGDGAICADRCGLIPVTGQSLLSAKIITQPTVTGVVAPSAALRSDPDGSVSVIDETGVAHVVTVVASAKGMSVIEGAAAGLRVRVPATGEASG
ncbi:peptidoglycan-binding domain-containing protein [Agromyces larvae]|uniref:Peptidoglycan-binding protein n=1 Tax=Agromyces larvae TaxID=2929802 RepID=A0ABY4BXB6_9MICO|nr:peptidoglycan-binding domain-containing protein [Agromyces larvae]UOE42827.1 peptidoglycan-binding protein [Agromyces larvae]